RAVRAVSARWVSHRGIGARAIPVVRIKNVWRNRMCKLQKSACILIHSGITTHELGRHLALGRRLDPGLYERSLQVLIAEVDYGCQVRIAAHPTPLLMQDMHYDPFGLPFPPDAPGCLARGIAIWRQLVPFAEAGYGRL